MMRATHRHRIAGLGAAVTLTMAASAAAQPSAPDVRPDVPIALVSGLHGGGHIEDYVARVVRELRQVDRSVDGLDQGDIDFAMARRAAVQRAGPIPTETAG